jgi:hypothetical protein
MMPERKKTAFIACGALARELQTLIGMHGWDVEILGIPALLHNRPDLIPAAVQKRIREARDEYDRIVIVYGDCGTGGQLDALLEQEKVSRIAGPHCYEMYGYPQFEELMQAEIGTFFLTDFMVREFDSLVIRGLGLDRYPDLRDDYFGNYKRVVYLAQFDDADLRAKAREAAQRLDLPLEIHPVGYGALNSRLVELMTA